MEFWVLGQPLLVELLELLLEGFHTSLEMNLQPFAAADGKESHTLRHTATLINTANHVGEGLVAASAKIHFCTGHAVVVGDVAGTESEPADAVVDGRLLKGIWSLVFHKHGLYNPFHILAPELRALFLSLTECDFLGHADNLHPVQRNHLVFHLSYYLFVFVLIEIEVRPAGVLGIEMLLAAILEAETFVEPVGGSI